MILKSRVKMYNYSENALQQIVEQAVHKPFMDENTEQLGTIVKATRIDNTDVIEFEIDTEVI